MALWINIFNASSSKYHKKAILAEISKLKVIFVPNIRQISPYTRKVLKQTGRSKYWDHGCVEL